jgi:cytochrome c-type biogenesis protein CcmE
VEKTVAEAQPASSSTLGGKHIKLIVGAVIITVTAAYLIFSAARGSAAYYMTISELQELGSPKRNVRISGFIVPDSIVWEPRDLLLEFTVMDEGGSLPVTYTGARPDMFKDGAEVVIEGQAGADGVFQAKTIILKCPSKYEGAD